MTKIDAAQLTCAALDWEVAKALGDSVEVPTELLKGVK
uniref:Uncharacterized protein n=1 Tax=feces metagenome TaxID=1861841 RepID=A0A7M2QMA2_9ZZZZ